MKQRLDIEQKRLDDIASIGEAADSSSTNSRSTASSESSPTAANRVASMRVTSPESGQLQALGNPPLELGQYVNAGMLLARVVQPGKLKAVLRVPENLAKDVVPNLPATIDLHNNTVVKGHVIRTDPSSVQGTVTVEVSIDDPLPAGHALPTLAVDGTIQIEKLTNVMYIGRPGFGQAESSVGIFKVTKNKGEANRVNVLPRPRLREPHRSEGWSSGRRQRDHLRHVAVRRHEPRSYQVVSSPPNPSPELPMATESASSSTGCLLRQHGATSR